MRSVFLQPFRIERNLRRSLSAGLALVLIGGVAAVPFVMLDSCHQHNDEIEVLRAEVAQLTGKALAPEGRQTSDLPKADDTTDILAPDAEAAATHLQATLRGLAAELGTTEIRVDSVRVLPPLPEGAAIAVRVSASLTAPGPCVFEVVNALEASKPPIVIDSLRIISRTEASAGRGGGLRGTEMARGELTLVLRVYAQSASAPLDRREQAEDGPPARGIAVRGLPFTYPDVVLTTGNAILSLVLWRIVTADPTPQASMPPIPMISATVNAASPPFNRVARRSDPAAGRLFGLPPAEGPTLVKPVEAAQSREPALRLVGVILVEETDGERVALVEYGEPAHIARLRKGVQLGSPGWRVERISSSSVELVRGEEHRILKLD